MGVEMGVDGLKQWKSASAATQSTLQLVLGIFLFWVIWVHWPPKRAVGCMGKQKAFGGVLCLVAIFSTLSSFFYFSFVLGFQPCERCNGISSSWQRGREVCSDCLLMVNLNRGSCCHGDGRLHPTMETKVKKLMLRAGSHMTWFLFCFVF